MLKADEICTSFGLLSSVFDTWASILARKHFGSVQESLRTSAKSSLLNPVRFGQCVQERAAATRDSSCLSNGADASCSRMLDSIHAASSRTGMRSPQINKWGRFMDSARSDSLRDYPFLQNSDQSHYTCNSLCRHRKRALSYDKQRWDMVKTQQRLAV